MDVRVPPKVAQTAERLALGELIGRYPQAANRIIEVLCWAWAVPFGFGTLGVIPHFPGFGPLGVPWPNAVVLISGTCLFVWLALRVRRHRVLFLYRQGIIATTTWGNLRLSARWEDIQVSSSRVRTFVNGGYVGTSHRYELSVLGKVKLRHASWRPGGLGPLMMATAVAAKTPWALEQLRAGRKIYFGPVAAEPGGVSFLDRAFGNHMVIPWAQLTLSNENGAWRLGASDRRTSPRYLGEIPDNAVLLNVISTVKADPSALTPTS
jgi:hypothetical protein